MPRVVRIILIFNPPCFLYGLMTYYGDDEFYGDLVGYRLERARKWMSSTIFYILAALFLIVFIPLWIKPEETNELLTRLMAPSLNHHFPENRYQWLVLAGLLFIIMPFIPTVLHVVRKYVLYPKSSLTQQTFLAVHSKKLIIHPRTKNANSHPKSHLIFVQHPSSSKLIPVDTEATWFGELKEGDRVRAFYHPAEGNILYLKKG